MWRTRSYIKGLQVGLENIIYNSYLVVLVLFLFKFLAKLVKAVVLSVIAINVANRVISRETARNYGIILFKIG